MMLSAPLPYPVVATSGYPAPAAVSYPAEAAAGGVGGPGGYRGLITYTRWEVRYWPPTFGLDGG
jgi:hypothetical protein